MTAARAKAGTGIVMLLGLLALGALALGALALTSPATHDDLAVDQALVSVRFGVATTISTELTRAASELAGLGLLAIGVVVLLVWRRRWDAARLAAMAGGSWVLALGVKSVFGRPRPPARLWLLRPDHSPSFPSGHTTTAVVIFLVVAVLAWHTPRWRSIAIALGAVFALAVGASRLYPGDHYPTDVVGSYLAATAAVLLVWAVSDLVPVRRLAGTLLRIPEPSLPPGGKPVHSGEGSSRPRRVVRPASTRADHPAGTSPRVLPPGQ